VDQRDVRGDVRKVQRLFDGRVAAADHGDALAPEKEAVAGRTRRDTAAAKCGLGVEAQVLGTRTGRDHERVARVITAVALEQQRPAFEVDLVDVIHQDLGVEPLGVLAHALHETRARETVRIARPVVDLGGRHELATLFHAGDEQRPPIRARGIHGRRITRRAGTEDDQPGVAGVAHVQFLRVSMRHGPRGAAW
jgi:hypothetical protein